MVYLNHIKWRINGSQCIGSKMKKQKEKPKEYESITTVKCDGKLIDLITLLTYTPFDGGKGSITRIRNHIEEKE